MLEKINTRFLFWAFIFISILLIILIKFSPLKDIPASRTESILGFPYGYELGEILYAVSVSYIVSCIFYLVVVFLPERKKRMRAMSIIENRVDSILGYINVLVSYYFHKHNIKVIDNENFKNEVEAINKLDLDRKMDFRYQTISKISGQKVPNATGEYTEEMLLEDYRSRIEQNIESIFRIPVIINVDHNLIVTLEQIRNSLFIRSGSTRKELQKYFPREAIMKMNIETPEFGKDLYAIYLLHQELSHYITPTKYFFEQK